MPSRRLVSVLLSLAVLAGLPLALSLGGVATAAAGDVVSQLEIGPYAGNSDGSSFVQFLDKGYSGPLEQVCIYARMPVPSNFSFYFGYQDTDPQNGANYNAQGWVFADNYAGGLSNEASEFCYAVDYELDPDLYYMIVASGRWGREFYVYGSDDSNSYRDSSFDTRTYTSGWTSVAVKDMYFRLVGSEVPDIAPPGIVWNGTIDDGDSFLVGSVPAEPTCSATDDGSGPAGCNITGYGTAVGPHTLTATAYDVAGNMATETRSYTVLPPAGSIVGWGYNSSGQASPPAGNDYVAISVGEGFSLALRSDGSIVGWGYGPSGQASPPPGNDFVAIDNGLDYGLALRSDGSIVAWGSDGYGLASPPAGNDFVAIAAGVFHGLALREDGSIAGWGYNPYGQASPPPGNDYVAISAGLGYSLALREDGSIVAWGLTPFGDPPAGNDYVAISAGVYHGLALREDGSIADLGAMADPPSGNDFVAISAGLGYSLALREDGSIVGWGRNDYGQASPPPGNGYVAIAAFAQHSLALVAIRYQFDGFFQPIDMTAVNVAKAGQAVPFKWRLTDANGVGISDPASFLGLHSYPVNCSDFAGDPVDAIEEYAPGSSGLQYNGDGRWQFNWKTPNTYAGTCRAMYVRFDSGQTSPIVYFKYSMPTLEERTQAVRDDLAALLPTGNHNDDKALGKAIESLDKSLKPAYWVDGDTLAAKDGSKVFDEDKKAVKELGKVAGVDVSGAIEALVAIDGELAQGAIDDAWAAYEAAGCNVTPTRACQKAADELGNAAEEMAKAADDLLRGDYDKVIDHYKNAWEKAAKALKELS